MPTSLKSIRGSFAFGACLLIASAAGAQTPPAQQTNAVLSSQQLEQEATLTAPVSFESQRQPLSQLLSKISQQSGVALSVADEALKTRLVTARVKQMPLSQLMPSLARLYGGFWQKGQQGFELHSQEKSPLEMMQLQAAGGAPSFRALPQYLMGEEEFEDLRSGIIDDWAAKNPEKFAPIAISELPEDVRLRLRYALGQKAIVRIIDQYTKVTERLSPESTLVFSRVNNGRGSQFKLGLSDAKTGYRLFPPIESQFVLNRPQPALVQNQNP